MLEIHNGVLSAMKRNEVRSVTGRWVQLEVIRLKKIDQSQKDKDHVSGEYDEVYDIFERKCLYENYHYVK